MSPSKPRLQAVMTTRGDLPLCIASKYAESNIGVPICRPLKLRQRARLAGESEVPDPSASLGVACIDSDLHPSSELTRLMCVV
jgi:hypothetical protein